MKISLDIPEHMAPTIQYAIKLDIPPKWTLTCTENSTQIAIHWENGQSCVTRRGAPSVALQRPSREAKGPIYAPRHKTPSTKRRDFRRREAFRKRRRQQQQDRGKSANPELDREDSPCGQAMYPPTPTSAIPGTNYDLPTEIDSLSMETDRSQENALDNYADRLLALDKNAHVHADAYTSHSDAPNVNRSSSSRKSQASTTSMPPSQRSLSWESTPASRNVDADTPADTNILPKTSATPGVSSTPLGPPSDGNPPACRPKVLVTSADVHTYVHKAVYNSPTISPNPSPVPPVLDLPPGTNILRFDHRDWWQSQVTGKENLCQFKSYFIYTDNEDCGIVSHHINIPREDHFLYSFSTPIVNVHKQVKKLSHAHRKIIVTNDNASIQDIETVQQVKRWLANDKAGSSKKIKGLRQYWNFT